MDINPNVNQDDSENVFTNRRDSSLVIQTDSALWFRLDWLVRSLEQSRETVQDLRMHLVNQTRIMNESKTVGSVALENARIYRDASKALDDWLKAIPQ